MKFKLGDAVEKVTGDYRFRGQVRAAFTKTNGQLRYVVENDDGILHIFSESNEAPNEKAAEAAAAAELISTTSSVVGSWCRNGNERR